jgi:hypothetical protein
MNATLALNQSSITSAMTSPLLMRTVCSHRNCSSELEKSCAQPQITARKKYSATDSRKERKLCRDLKENGQ